MSEHASVHEAVQQDDEHLHAAGEDVGLTIDRTANDHPHASAALADAKRYRKRAQAAEKTVEELTQDLAKREQTLREQQQEIATLQQRQELEHLLYRANAIDLDAARTLAEAAMATSQDTDAASTVADLQRTKPYLFQHDHGSARRMIGRGVMSALASETPTPRDHAIDRAATEARETGSRTDLLRYLRLRRKT